MNKTTDDKPGEDKPATPSLGGPRQLRAKQRESRQAAALRANLSRRKSQTRARHGAGETGEPGDGHGEGSGGPKA